MTSLINKKKKVITEIVNGCPICTSSSNKCYRCEIKELKAQNIELKDQLIKLLAYEPDELIIDYMTKMKIKQSVLESNAPMEFEYLTKLNNSYFITLTFDPSKFGVIEFEKQRKQYILKCLLELREQELFTECYGCFEYHDNGLIHSHLIMVTNYSKAVYKLLQPKFTNKKENKKAIQMAKAKHPQAQQYIEKESKHYYYMNFMPSIVRTIDMSIGYKIKKSKPILEINPLDM